MKAKLLSVAIVLAVLTIISPAFAADINAFTASPDGLWTNTANWVFGVPDNTTGLLDPWARLASDNVTVDTHVAETTYRTQVGYANNASTLTILSSGSLTNAEQLQVGAVTRTSRNGVTSTMTIYGDYIGTSNQAINVGLVSNTAEYTGGFHNGVLDVDGGTVSNAGGVLNVANYGTTSVGETLYTNDAQGTVIIQNGATVTALKMEINSNSDIGAGANNDSITINDSTFNLVGGYETISQLDGQFYATNSTLKLGDTLVTRNSSGFAIIGGAGAKDLELAELRINTDGAVISNVNLTGLATLEVGNNSDTTASLLLNFAGSVTNESIDGNADGDPNDNIDQRGGFKVAASANTIATLDFDAGEIVMVANALMTNDLLIGTGNGSEGTLNLGDGATLKGTVGDFKLGGGNAKAADLVNSLVITGDDLWTGTDMVITNDASGGNFTNLATLSAGFMQNSSGTLAVSNSSGIALGDTALTVASGNGSSFGLVAEGGAIVMNTNDLSIGMGFGSTVTALPSLSGTIGTLAVGEGAENALGQAALDTDTIGEIQLNTTTMQITSGVHDITGLRIGYSTDATGSYLNDATSQLPSITNLLVGNGARSTGTWVNAGQDLNVSGTIVVANGTGSSGDFIMNGGSVTTLNMRVGSGGLNNGQEAWGSLVATGGNIYVSNTMGIGGQDNNSNRRGTVLVDNGATVEVVGAVNIAGFNDTNKQDNEGYLTVSNGTFNAASFSLAFDNTSTGMIHLADDNANVTANGLNAGRGSNSLGRVTVDAGTLTVLNNAIFGQQTENSRGELVVNGGTVRIGDANANNNDLRIGNNVNSTGTATFAGGDVVIGRHLQLGLNNADSAQLADGKFAYGEINMTGGSITITNDSLIGFGTGSVAQVMITGGAWTNLDSIFVGNKHLADGKVVVSGSGSMFGNIMELGANETLSHGELYVTNGGTLLLQDTAGADLAIGAGGVGSTGAAVFDGATVKINDQLNIAQDAGNTGTFSSVNTDLTIGDNIVLGGDQKNDTKGTGTISGGTLTLGSGNNDLINVAGQGNDTTNQWGSLNIDVDNADITLDSINVGSSVASYGELWITNATTTVNMDSGINAGGGTGSTGLIHLAAIGGDIVGNNLNADWNVGSAIDSYGVLEIGSAEVSAIDAINVASGLRSKGRVVVSGGSVTNQGQLYVGSNVDSDGFASFASLSSTGAVGNTLLNVNVGSGSNAVGTLKIGGGTLAGRKAFSVGTGNYSEGLLELSNMTVTNRDVVTIGANLGTGTANFTNVNFRMEADEPTGTTPGNGHNKELRVGVNAGGTGTLNLVGGSFDATGDGGNDVQIGLNSSSTGTVNMSSGAALSGDIVQIGAGNGALGTLNVTDSSITANQLVVGNSSGGEGVATISGSSVLDLQQLKVGQNSSTTRGTLNIEGGIINVGTTDAGDGHFSIGNASNTTAVVNMSGGTLSMQDVSGTSQLRIGINGQGTLNLSGGQINATNQQVNIGQNNGGNGVLNLSGTGIFNAANKNVYLGASSNSTGTANVYGGQMIANRIDVGNNADGIGFFTVTGGVINVANAMNVGASGTGTLTMEGGTLSVGDLVIGGGVTGAVSLLDGVLNITQENTLTIGSSGLLVIEGGTLNWNTGTKTDGEIFTIFDDFIASGQITWSNTVADAPVAFDYSWANGDGSTLFLNIDGGTSTLIAAIPEPATIGMMMAFGGGLLFLRRRLRK